jgi:glycosyltransferase involved in cell wall biosynthesis
MASRRLQVLALPRYGPAGASSRYRFYQFIPLLGQAGIDVTVSPLLPDQYVLDLYSGRPRRPGMIAAALTRRLLNLLREGSHDLLWIEGELFPWLPALAESLMGARTRPYVVDYDDAIFHRYGLHKSISVRRFLGEKIDKVMRGAAAVVAGSPYLFEHARAVGASTVVLVPTVVDMRQYDPLPQRPAQSFTMVWIGSPSTQNYLKSIEPALAEVSHEGARLKAIGVSPDFNLKDVVLERLRWTEATEARMLSDADVGIMPLTDDPWSRGKCGFKLVQYMASGLPVVASPVGANTSIVLDGISGFLAADLPSWVASLRALRADARRRSAMGMAGRRRAEQLYSVEAAFPQLVDVLRRAAAGTG